MALFPQFPYGNLHELNLDWLIENISQLVKDGTVISVNGMSGRVTLYTEKDVELPPRAFDANWSIYRRIADKMAGLQFTGEKFFYITKNVDDEDFTIQEVFTSNNPPPYPVTSVNGRIGTVIIAGDNTPYNMDGVDTIESVVSNIQKAIGPVVQYTSCSVGVTAGQYVYLFMSGISGRTDGIYKAANNKAANTTWTSADLLPVTNGVGGLIAELDNKTAFYNLGIIDSMANLKTAINNMAATIVSGVGVFSFSPTFTDNDAGFFDATYGQRLGTIYVRDSTHFSCIITYNGGINTSMSRRNETWTVDTFVLNSSLKIHENQKEWASNTTTLSEVCTYAENLIAGKSGFYYVGYANAAASGAIGLPSGAYFITIYKHNDDRMALSFINIETGLRCHVAKVNTWSSNIIVVNS